MPTRMASQRERRIIQKILDKSARVATLCSEREEHFKQLGGLIGDETVIAEVEVAEISETRTFKLGRPRGKYVMFAEQGFVMNRKTSRDDITVAETVTPLL